MASQTQIMSIKLKAMSCPTRLEILRFLSKKPAMVNEILSNCENVGTQSNLSQQLILMFNKNILDRRRDSNRVYYNISDPDVFTILDVLGMSDANKEEGVPGNA